MPQRHAIRFHLRAGTGDAHDRVDHAFAGYDLGDAGSYATFLTAHARVVLPLERALDAGALWPEWAARGGLLRADLAALGVAVPYADAVDAGTEAERWGLLYVLEGSRLGGAMLARGVPDGLPAAYLGAVHGPGDWRTIRAAIDAAAVDRDDAWRERMTAGALASFDLYARAAVTD